MLKPLIKTIRVSESPWQVFQAIYSKSEVCYFLDSPQYAPPDQNYSYIGLNPFLQIRVEQGEVRLSGEKRGCFPAEKVFSVLRKLLAEYRLDPKVKKPFFLGGAVGFFGYELVSLFERIEFRKKKDPGLGDLHLGFFREGIIYDHKKKVFYLVALYQTKPKKKAWNRASAQKRLVALEKWGRFSFFHSQQPPGLLTPGVKSLPKKKNRPQLKVKAEMSRREFVSMVKRAKTYIAAGDIYQANLSQRFRFQFKDSALGLYEHLRRINPSPFCSFFKMGDTHIISSSPERLMRKTGNHCETKPIAGTSPRRNGKSPKQLLKNLISSEKERAEHIMLVDLERNDLGRVCDFGSVKVKERMQIETYSHVYHIVSKITGKMKPEHDALDFLQAMFPGGTITGCPKVRCMEIIDELEPVRRGVYTGSLGYIDFKGDLDLNIVIRTFVLNKDRGYVQVGAGIVHDSDPQKEYEETLHKGQALFEALKA